MRLVVAASLGPVLQNLSGQIGDRHHLHLLGHRARMGLPVAHQSRSLGKALVADVALVGPHLGVHEHVLIIIAARGEELVADAAGDTWPVLGLVIHKLSRSGEILAAGRAVVALHVAHQMVLQLGLAAKFLEAEAARVHGLLLHVLELLLMVPLVRLDVLHRLAAEPADLVAAHVHLIDVQQQVLLQLVLFAAVVAHERGLDVAVHAHVMALKRLLPLVLQMADAALEVRVGVVGLAMARQHLLVEVLAPAEIALERLLVGVAHVLGYLVLVLEATVAVGTDVAEGIEIRHRVL